MLKELEQARRQINNAVGTDNPHDVIRECLSVSASLAMLLSSEGQAQWAERFFEAADFLAAHAAHFPDNTPAGPEPAPLKVGADYAAHCIVLHARGFEYPVTLSIPAAIDLIMQLTGKSAALTNHLFNQHRNQS